MLLVCRWSSTKQNSRYHWSAGPKQAEMREIESDDLFWFVFVRLPLSFWHRTTLRTDMTDWDSSIWPLSSYSYERYKPCIGGENSWLCCTVPASNLNFLFRF